MSTLAQHAPRAVSPTFITALRSLFSRKKRRIPRNLSQAQMKDAGITWELAGYGRGADVSMLAITISQSQR